MKRLYSQFVFLLLLLIVVSGQAQTLSGEAVFHRCYAHVTQMSSYFNPQLRNQVINGRDPIEACLQVLDSAQLTANNGTQISDITDQEMLKVLSTFQSLHHSWESVKPIASGSSIFLIPSMDFLDNATPAFYFTKALLAPNTPIDYVVTTNESLRAVRENMNPTRSHSRGVMYNEGLYFDGDEQFTPMGEMYGLYDAGPMVMLDNGTPYETHRNYGGGIIGTTAFLLKTSNVPDIHTRQDGAVTLFRGWGKNILNDLLCRDLPAARDVDAQQYVVPAGPNVAPFRTAAACAKCHASMDQLTGVIRNIAFRTIVGGNVDFDAMFPHFNTPDRGDLRNWGATPNTDYRRTNPYGKLYYRSYDGQLVDIELSGLQDLGNKIAQTDDFYVCTAKKYYQYFTGISADLGDLGDPAYGGNLSSLAQFHRDEVIRLGLDLKQHKSSRRLIEDILRLPIYRESDLGIGQ